jgi:hypothetical protein
MKTPFDTADANRKFDAAEGKLLKLINRVASGDQDAERSAFRTVDAIDELRRWVDAGRDERRGHRARVVEAAESGRLARASGGEAEIARLRQAQREAQPLPGSYESELRLMRRNAPNSGHGRAYRVWRGNNEAAAVYVTAPNVWGAVERAMDERGWADMDDVRAEVRIGGEWQPAVEHEANARRKRAQSMEDETSLMPEAVADAVTEEVEQYVGLEHGSLRPLANELADQARAIYGANADFAKKLRADSGRDTLYSFMRHWLAALLKKKRPDVFAKLPSGYGWERSHLPLEHAPNAKPDRRAERSWVTEDLAQAYRLQSQAPTEKIASAIAVLEKHARSVGVPESRLQWLREGGHVQKF